MKKSTNLTINLKSGVEAQISIVRTQGYEENKFNLDGIEDSIREYNDRASINVTIAKANVINEPATLDGSFLNTFRNVGTKRQFVKAQLKDEDAATIASLIKEILSGDDKAEYEAKTKAAREVEEKYEQHRDMMRKVMGY